MKRIISVLLASAMMLFCFTSVGISADNGETYPELVITEIGTDQYCDDANTKNTNTKYKSMPDADPFEFIEVYNNSDKTLNIYDYMVAYQGCSSSNAECFEKSVQCYTPVYPGADWWKTKYTAYDAYWKNGGERPENPAYAEGTIAPGECAVLWIYNSSSHTVRADFAQFRSFWSVKENVKIFLVDGNDVESDTCFSLKNKTTGTYMIMHQSERFPSRRAADTTYYCENDNTHHNYEGKTYKDLEEVLSWAAVDYRTEPLKTYTEANGNGNAKTNYTVSFLPFAAGAAYTNGYTVASFAALGRMHLETVNSYTEATVGALDAKQTSAFAAARTTVVTTEHVKQISANNSNSKADLLITEISADQTAAGSKNTNAAYAAKSTSDPYEFIEVYNNSGRELNIYDYMFAYQGGAATGVSTYFERSVQEYTPVFPGADWEDGPYTTHDASWKDSSVAKPVNPEYSGGVLKAGEVCLVWVYSGDAHSFNATVAEFRTFWDVPEDVKVFLLDGDSTREMNFNIKNSDTGEYIIMQESERFLARRSDDESYYVEADRSDHWYCEETFAEMPEIVSWAVIDFGCYDPLYTYLNNGTNNNYTINYAPYFGEDKFENGVLTTSFASQKRCRFYELNKKYAGATAGRLSDGQKTAIEKANTIK